jgi:hypothetical protein
MRWCPSCKATHRDPVDKCEFCGYTPERQATLIPARPRVVLTANPSGPDVWKDWMWNFALTPRDREFLHQTGIQP